MVARPTPEWLIPRLQIIDEQGKRRPIVDLHPEQVEVMQAFGTHDQILILKPRQIGITTIVLALLYVDLTTCPDPISLLSITHEMGAMGRMNGMLRTFNDGVPRMVRPPLTKDNSRELEWAHNGAIARQVMAGGRGAARSHTHQMLHATEMGFWPKGSAASAGADVDRTMWASANATLHEGPHRKVVVESTGDGPTGIFYELCKAAQTSSDWAFLFFPWSRFSAYELDVPKDWRPAREEEELAVEWGLSDRKLAWRRAKLITMGGDVRRFRKEYPLSWMDPFLLTDQMWFDIENLNRWAASLSASVAKTGLTVFHPYEAGRNYYIGQDTSGGSGGDDAALQVLRDDLVQCARWRSNTTKPLAQAEMAAAVSIMYGRALVLCEANNHGKVVIEKMDALGVNLWKSHGKDWYTQRGSSLNTKEWLFDHAAPLVDGNLVEFGCPVTVAQLMLMMQHADGSIGPATGADHDDLAMAFLLALWCAKSAPRGERARPSTLEQRRRRIHRALGLGTTL
jgi:hypothetical protein